jgi:hypothetical protein
MFDSYVCMSGSWATSAKAGPRCTGLSGADIGRLIGLDVHALLNLAVHVSPCDPGLAHKIERQEAVAERPQRRSQGPPRAGPRRSESGAPRALASEI